MQPKILPARLLLFAFLAVPAKTGPKTGQARPKYAGIFRFILFSCALGVLAHDGRSETRVLKLGTRTFEVNQETSQGSTVIPMWKAQMPAGSQAKAVGFPVPGDAQHFDVWKPARRNEGAYNHYACLVFHNERFYAMWGNHWFGEDGPGQRILFATSKDGRSWTPPGIMFPPPGPIQKPDQNGIHLKPDRWVEADGKLHAIAYVFQSGGGVYPIARELRGEGVLGEPFLLRDLPAKAALPSFMPAPRQNPALAAKIIKWHEDNDTISWWARPAGEIPLRSIDKASLIESFAFRSKDGMVICMRDFTGGDPSNRLYACFSDGKGGWSALYPTDIPDAPSRAQALRLPDGRVLLVGSQIAPRLDKGLHLSRDPLTLAVSPDGEFFTKVFALRSAGGSRPNFRFSGITGRGKTTSYGYPSMIVHDGMVYVLYSVNKEDMAVTIMPLSSISNNQ